MKLICLALLVAGCYSMAINDVEEQQWQQWKQQYRSENAYSSAEEEQYRRSVFVGHLRTINKHNEEEAQGVHTYTMAVNSLSDLTTEEFLAKYTSKIDPIDMSQVNIVPVNESFVPANDIDWRSRGVVGPVKNQGGCGSCWAFATVAQLESRLAIKSGRFRTFSEQEILDCLGGYSCNRGGNIQMATQTLARLGGIEGDNDYPYVAGSGRVDGCHYDGGRRAARVGAGLNYLGGENGLAGGVQNTGPVYVHVFVNGNFQHYGAGVFRDGGCNQPINHAVTVVGFGGDFWIIKNSWGTGWGQLGGYMLMGRGQNMCRIGESPIWSDDINY